jgi:hypothetical protein
LFVGIKKGGMEVSLKPIPLAVGESEEKIVYVFGRVGSVFLGFAYWAATRTSIGSGSSVMVRVGLAKV